MLFFLLPDGRLWRAPPGCSGEGPFLLCMDLACFKVQKWLYLHVICVCVSVCCFSLQNWLKPSNTLCRVWATVSNDILALFFKGLVGGFLSCKPHWTTDNTVIGFLNSVSALLACLVHSCCSTGRGGCLNSREIQSTLSTNICMAGGGGGRRKWSHRFFFLCDEMYVC